MQQPEIKDFFVFYRIGRLTLTPLSKLYDRNPTNTPTLIKPLTNQQDTIDFIHKIIEHHILKIQHLHYQNSQIYPVSALYIWPHQILR